MSAHGTRTRYVRGCRCEDCSEANSAYQRAYMAQRFVPAAESPHGFEGYRRRDGSVSVGRDLLR